MLILLKKDLKKVVKVLDFQYGTLRGGFRRGNLSFLVLTLHKSQFIILLFRIFAGRAKKMEREYIFT